MCQKWKVKLIFRGAYRLSGTGIVECMEIGDQGCNLKQFYGLTSLTLTLIFYDIYSTAQKRASLSLLPCYADRMWASAKGVIFSTEFVCLFPGLITQKLFDRCSQNSVRGKVGTRVTFPQCCDLYSMVLSLECTRVHFVQVSVSDSVLVSRPRKGLDNNTAFPPPETIRICWYSGLRYPVVSVRVGLRLRSRLTIHCHALQDCFTARRGLSVPRSGVRHTALDHVTRSSADADKPARRHVTYCT